METKEGINKNRYTPCTLMGEFNIVNMSALPNFMFGLNKTQLKTVKVIL
jgi:hypothetical protein